MDDGGSIKSEKHFRQLRDRRVLSLFNNVILRTIRVLDSCTQSMAIAPFWFSTDNFQISFKLTLSGHMLAFSTDEIQKMRLHLL